MVNIGSDNVLSHLISDEAWPEAMFNYWVEQTAEKFEAIEIEIKKSFNIKHCKFEPIVINLSASHMKNK